MTRSLLSTGSRVSLFDFEEMDQPPQLQLNLSTSLYTNTCQPTARSPYQNGPTPRTGLKSQQTSATWPAIQLQTCQRSRNTATLTLNQNAQNSPPTQPMRLLLWIPSRPICPATQPSCFRGSLRQIGPPGRSTASFATFISEHLKWLRERLPAREEKAEVWHNPTPRWPIGR